jgi:hypothetical protein
MSKPQGTAGAVNVPTPAMAPPAAAQPGLRMKAHGAPAEPPPAAPVAAAAAPVEVGRFCSKHQNQPAVESCRVCHKPMCAQCMKQFGYVCSIFCRDQAANKKVVVPKFAGQKKMYQDQAASSRTKLIVVCATLVLLVVAGVGIWYTYMAREPKVVYSVTFPKLDASDREFEEFIAPETYELIAPNRLLAMKNKRVSLMDVLKKQELWSIPLQTEAEAAAEKAARDKNAETVKNAPVIRDGEGRIQKRVGPLDPIAWKDERELSDPRVIAAGNDLWMVFRVRLFRLDMATGAKKDSGIADKIIGMRASTNCILVTTRTEAGAQNLVRLAVADGSQQTEEIAPAAKGGARGSTTSTNTTGARPTMAATTPTNRPAANPMTMASGTRGPAPGARAAGPMTRGGTPAARSTNAGNNAIAMANSLAGTKKADAADLFDYSDDFSEPFIAAGPNVVEFKTRLLERRTTERQAMKPAPAPGKSVLDDKNLTASRGVDLAEEMANQAQREATGGVELQNVSRYEVSLHRRFAAGAQDWKDEVIGQPAFVPLETVDLVTGFTNLIAFDKNNKKLWEAKLTFPVPYYSRFLDEEVNQPALETKDAVYFADKGMVTRFDKDTGNPRWRYNTVGVSRITSDSRGDIYVDTTTDKPESIKYSQQVSFREKAELQIVKLEGATGKKLWDTKYESDTYHSRPSGKFLYSTRSWQIQDPLRLEEGPDTLFNIKLVKPSDGNAIWTYPVPGKHPTGTQIQEKWILLKFREKIIVLNFFSL